MAPAAYGDEDILGLLAGGSLSDALASQGAIPLERRGRDGGEVRPHMGSIAETGGAASWGGGTTSWLPPHLPKGCQMPYACHAGCRGCLHKESCWFPLPPPHFPVPALCVCC